MSEGNAYEAGYEAGKAERSRDMAHIVHKLFVLVAGIFFGFAAGSSNPRASLCSALLGMAASCFGVAVFIEMNIRINSREKGEAR